MKKVITDNKGYMLVEIIVASVIALIMAYFLMDITIKLVNKNNDYYLESILLADKNVITKEIMDDINNKKLTKVNVSEDGTSATLTYDDGEEKILIVDKDNKTITYGNYKKKLSSELNLGVIEIIQTNDILTVFISAYTNYSKEDYGIKITVPYSEDIEITYPLVGPDIRITSITVDGAATTTFPTGSYSVDVNCPTATATYDYVNRKLKISNVSVSKNATCMPKFTTTTRTTMANYIKNLLGTNTSVVSESKTGNGSTLAKITENGEEDYRYRGIDPANYIMFNNELWRIIGVFDDNTHGITDTHLVKIIRNDSIGQYLWDNDTTVHEYGSNNFPNSDIYNILNVAYYNHVDSTGEDYCYAELTSISGKCDFTRIGIQTEYQSMVESNVNWFLGGYSSTSVTSSAMYNYERSTTKYSLNNTTTKEAGLTVPVGLMYASDYGYAAPSTCTGNLENYNTSGCANKNWLKSNYYELTLTHNSSDSYEVFYVDEMGDVGDYHANHGRAILPTLYLKSNIYYLSGTGTQTDPYIIVQ